METKENYYNLLDKINALGPIEEIVNDENIINQIISYNGDRHLIYAFFDKVNMALQKKQLNPESLTYFRSGKLMDSIINLEETLEKCGSTRKPYTAEKLDKINYISLIDDKETLAISYTHPKILDAICRNSNSSNTSDLTWWYKCGTFTGLPYEVQAAIGLTLLKTRGNDELVKSMLENASRELPSYEEKNKVNSMKR